MILVSSSKYLSSLLFCTRDLGFLVWSCCFVKRRLFSPYKRHFTIVEKFAYFKTGWLMILVKSFKNLSSLLFWTKDLGFFVWSCCFFKRRLFSPYKRHFTIVEKFAYFKTRSLMILVISSKYLSSLLFCSRDLGFVVWSRCFLKRRLFSP